MGCIKQQAKHVYTNFIQDCFTYECHGMSYDSFMTKVIDYLINFQDKECNSPDRRDNVNQDIDLNRMSMGNKRGLYDLNNSSKSKGYIA